MIFLMQVACKEEWYARKGNGMQERKKIAKIDKWIHFFGSMDLPNQIELESHVKCLWRNEKELRKSLIHSWIHTAAQHCASRHIPENRKISPTQHFSMIKHEMIAFSNDSSW